MTLRLSGHFSKFGFVFFVLNSLLGIARHWSREKFTILTLKPRSHARILIYRPWASQTRNLTFTPVESFVLLFPFPLRVSRHGHSL